MEKIIAIIPARGGSKRLPRKNVLPLGDSPLIVHTINAAKKSGIFDTILVSSDDEEIISIAKEHHALAPFKRPESISNDTASSVDVIKHALNFYKAKGENFTHFMLLQPTSPLRTSNSIKDSLNLLREKDAKAIISVTECDHPPEWSNKIDESLSLENFLSDDIKGKRSQDIPASYRLNGAIYLLEVDTFIKSNSLMPDKNTFAYKMSKEESIDIDSNIDFLLAQVIISQSKKHVQP